MRLVPKFLGFEPAELIEVDTDIEVEIMDISFLTLLCAVSLYLDFFELHRIQETGLVHPLDRTTLEYHICILITLHLFLFSLLVCLFYDNLVFFIGSSLVDNVLFDLPDCLFFLLVFLLLIAVGSLLMVQHPHRPRMKSLQLIVVLASIIFIYFFEFSLGFDAADLLICFLLYCVIGFADRRVVPEFLDLVKVVLSLLDELNIGFELTAALPTGFILVGRVVAN